MLILIEALSRCNMPLLKNESPPPRCCPRPCPLKLKSIYKMRASLPFPVPIDIAVGLKPINIHHQLPLRHEQVIIDRLQQLQLQSINIQLRNATDLRIVLVLIEEVVGELGRHHHRRYQQPNSPSIYRCTQYWFSTKPYSASCRRSM